MLREKDVLDSMEHNMIITGALLSWDVGATRVATC